MFLQFPHSMSFLVFFYCASLPTSFPIFSLTFCLLPFLLYGLTIPSYCVYKFVIVFVIFRLFISSLLIQSCLVTPSIFLRIFILVAGIIFLSLSVSMFHNYASKSGQVYFYRPKSPCFSIILPKYMFPLALVVFLFPLSPFLTNTVKHISCH